jgi:hypothetical protein
MDTTLLRDTYEQLAASAEPARFRSPVQAGPEWPVEMVVAHVIATNRTLVLLGTQVLDGREASYAGETLSVQPAWLEAIVRSAGSYAGLVVALRQSSIELLALADHFDDQAAGRTFSFGKSSWTFPELLRTYVTPLVRHARQISTLIGTAPNGPVSAPSRIA